MRHLLPVRVIFLSALLSTLGSCNSKLQNRAGAQVCTYKCPSTDANYMPLGLDSGPSNDSLRCTYPPLSYCRYDVTTGSLLHDADEGNCTTTATCSPTTCTSYECPEYDTHSLHLGPGSQTYGSALFCTYPSESQLNQTDISCNYNETTGSLINDFDNDSCPDHAVSQDCSTPPPMSTATETPTVVTRPSSTFSGAKIRAIAVGISLAILVAASAGFFIHRRRNQLRAPSGDSPHSPTFLHNQPVLADPTVRVMQTPTMQDPERSSSSHSIPPSPAPGGRSPSPTRPASS